MFKGVIGGIAIAAAIIFGLGIAGKCTTRVPAGYVAVQYNINGGIKDDVLTQGWHITSPTISTSLYTVGLEQSYLTAENKGDSPDDESFEASSSEGKAITIDLTYSYQFDADTVADVFKTFKGQSGTEVRDSFIKPNIISWTKEIVANYKVADIIGAERANINTALTDYLSQRFEKYNIHISNVSLINVEVDSDTQKAINEKIKAQQAAETAKITNQTAIDTAEAEATVKKTEAQASADAKLIAAKAEADAELIEAEATAKANKMISDSLTDNVLKQNYIDKWNGALPTYSASGDTSTLLNIE